MTVILQGIQCRNCFEEEQGGRKGIKDQKKKRSAGALLAHSKHHETMKVGGKPRPRVYVRLSH